MDQRHCIGILNTDSVVGGRVTTLGLMCLGIIDEFTRERGEVEVKVKVSQSKSVIP